uniref:TIMELESS domain-containing protein n=1 Tax=Macrostomum lignano TaxID=282301 RepID=A0A1I8GP92_9PLAT
LERVLVVLRNVLHAGGVDAAVNCGQDARDDPRICHERLIRCLLDAGLPRALVGLAANSAGCKHYSMHLLEILHLLLRHRNPAALAGGSAAVRRHLPANWGHGRGRPARGVPPDLNQLRDWSCDQDKTRRKVPKNRRLVVDDPRSTGAGGCDFEGGAAPITTSRVTEGLRDLCEALLARAFNPLMRRARQHLDSPSSQVGDETFYLWSVKFFFAYARHRPGGSRRPALHHLTAAFSLDSFGFVHRQIMTCAESANLERGANQAIWSRRLLLALSAYNQMFLVLSAAIALPSNSANKNGPADYETDPDWLAQVEESRALAREVLYLPEYRDAYPELLRSIQDRWAGLDLYREVLEGGFAMMRLMDRWARDGNLSRAKARRRRRQQGNKLASKRKAAKQQQQQATVLTEEQRDDLWNSFGDALSQLVSAPPEGVEAEVNEAGLPRLFDPLAPEAEQAASAAGAVQRLLIDGRLAES